MVRLIDGDDSERNRIAPGGSELSLLALQIVHDAINLLDHGFGQYLHFGSYFDSSDGAASDHKARNILRDLVRNDLSKGTVATTSVNTSQAVLNIQNALLSVYS